MLVAESCTRELKYATFADREPGLMAYLIIVLLLSSSKLGELHSFSAGGMTSQTNKLTCVLDNQSMTNWSGMGTLKIATKIPDQSKLRG